MTLLWEPGLLTYSQGYLIFGVSRPQDYWQNFTSFLTLVGIEISKISAIIICEIGNIMSLLTWSAKEHLKCQGDYKNSGGHNFIFKEIKKLTF